MACISNIFIDAGAEFSTTVQLQIVLEVPWTLQTTLQRLKFVRHTNLFLQLKLLQSHSIQIELQVSLI